MKHGVARLRLARICSPVAGQGVSPRSLTDSAGAWWPQSPPPRGPRTRPCSRWAAAAAAWRGSRRHRLVRGTAEWHMSCPAPLPTQAALVGSHPHHHCAAPACTSASHPGGIHERLLHRMVPVEQVVLHHVPSLHGRRHGRAARVTRSPKWQHRPAAHSSGEDQQRSHAARSSPAAQLTMRLRWVSS